TAPGPLVINQTLYTKGLPYDPARDFAPVALFAIAPIVLMVHPAVDAQNVQELIALARKQPGTISFASAGNGSTNHLAGEMFKSMANMDILHVPYRGAGPAMNDLIGGHVQMFFDLLPVSLPQIKAGKVRALGNAGGKRPVALPDLPTIAEQGLRGFDAASWVGLVAPAQTPAPILAKLADDVTQVLKSPDVVGRIRRLGAGPSLGPGVRRVHAGRAGEVGQGHPPFRRKGGLGSRLHMCLPPVIKLVITPPSRPRRTRCLCS